MCSVCSMYVALCGIWGYYVICVYVTCVACFCVWRGSWMTFGEVDLKQCGGGMLKG